MRILTCLLLAALLLSLSACFGPVKTQPVTEYSLTGLQLKSAKVSAKPISIRVADVQAKPPYNSHDMIYRKGLQLGSYNYHAWKASIPDMLDNLIVSALVQSHHYRYVTQSSSFAKTTYSLQTQVLGFEQVFVESQSYFKLMINVNLVTQPENKVIARRLFLIKVPASANTPQAGVVAANQAIHQFLSGLLQFLKHAR